MFYITLQFIVNGIYEHKHLTTTLVVSNHDKREKKWQSPLPKTLSNIKKSLKKTTKKVIFFKS